LLLSPAPSTLTSSTPSLHDALPIYELSVVAFQALCQSRQRGEGACATDKSYGLTDRNNLFYLRHTLCDVVRSNLHLSLRRRIRRDRKSTRLNSSHVSISYAVFCLKK